MGDIINQMEDMIRHPDKYGITREQAYKWIFNNINEAAEKLPKIPEHLRDELSDDIIAAYKEMKRRGSQDNNI